MVFVILNAHNVFEKLLEISKDLIAKQASAQLSYIRMMKSFVQHKSGVQWVMSYSSWTDTLSLILNHPVVNVFNGSCEVLLLFVEKVADLDYAVCSNVIQHILAPLRKENLEQYRDEDNLYEHLEPTLELLLFILRWLLEKIIVSPKYKLGLLFLDTFKLTEMLIDIKPTRNRYLIFKVHRLLGYTGPFTFIRMFHGLAAVEYSKYDKLCQECLENFYIIAETKLVKEILDCNYQFMMFWLKYKSKGLKPVMMGSTGKVLLIEDQLLLTLLFIISSRVSRFFLGEKFRGDLLEQDEIRDKFFTEALAKCTPQTVAMCYKIHNCWPKDTIFKDATLGLNYILNGRKSFTLDMANITVQFIIYSLKDITQNLKEKPQLWELLGADFFKYMTLLLDTMVKFFKEFNITWREITETISVLDIAFSCLVCYPHWPQNVVVKGLELVDVAISKYMSPNMALLIDKVHDSVMGLLGPMLYAKLHDVHWEVRDSALEVICTITRISNKKFPSYRKVIQEAEFPSMVIRLAKKDSEAFVRASALKCLKEMIQVEDFWWDFQNNYNIFEEILNILVYEPEGIVRTEAATVVATIYEYQDVPESHLGNMYDVASHAATADLHWEVKAKALMFWSKVIEKHLTHQGMIDGTFPEVTFSKENRKIVTLNDAEVKKRLIKVLEQLSATGCLAVFAAALQDDSDLEVAKTALVLIKDFVAMLKKYKVTEQDLVLSTPVSPLDSFITSPFPSASSVRSLDSQYGTMSPSSDVFQMDLVQASTPINDTILESILDSEDIGLLDSLPHSSQVTETVNLRTKQVMPNSVFINFIYGDLDGRLKERSRWLKQIGSFDSLLDDILKDYQVEGVNSMDCY
ncbi:unnamed protein product [Acanthoscelides obtectus]|nr:unnamed protein product [Acanthoscelides obtectus]CAK1650358.1 BRCA1-associated ATM activator 1 [Acanthoscelides obtectus]